MGAAGVRAWAPMRSASEEVAEERESPAPEAQASERIPEAGEDRITRTVSAEITGRPEVFPHQLRAGDVIVDEHAMEWELLGRSTKVVGSQDFTTTIRRVDRPADTREGRWRAPERVRVRRA
jgi:hypothetical protein